MDIANIIEAIQANRVRISDHADEEAEADQLTFDEIYFSVFHGEIIENSCAKWARPKSRLKTCARVGIADCGLLLRISFNKQKPKSYN